jgi:DNA/RNA endonuclease YhcR with UshA esterase domain
MSSHWSQHVSDDNPRGYTEKQKQKIADAGTLVKKRAVELKVMRVRLTGENNLKVPVDDEYGTDRINAMIADIEAEYAAMMGIAGAGAADEEEDGDMSDGF